MGSKGAMAGGGRLPFRATVFGVLVPVGVAALFFGPVSFAAALASPAGTVLPPYGGTTLFVSSTGVGRTIYTICAPGTMPVAPYFNSTTGAFGEFIGVRAHACGHGANDFNGNTVSTREIITIPFAVARNGTFNVSLNITFSLSARWNLTYGVCSEAHSVTGTHTCVQNAYYSADLYAHLGDALGSLLGETVNQWSVFNETSNTSTCRGGTCTSAPSGEPTAWAYTARVSLTLFLSASLTTSDIYEMEIYIDCAVSAEFYSAGAHLVGGHGQIGESLYGLVDSIVAF
jgi:hypothetical protein